MAKQWLHFLEAEDVPVVVCMTHADLRYNECMEKEDGNPEPTPYKIQEIGADLMVQIMSLFTAYNLYAHTYTHYNMFNAGTMT